jgi:hypothetical protein
VELGPCYPEAKEVIDKGRGCILSIPNPREVLHDLKLHDHDKNIRNDLKLEQSHSLDPM